MRAGAVSTLTLPLLGACASAAARLTRTRLDRLLLARKPSTVRRHHVGKAMQLQDGGAVCGQLVGTVFDVSDGPWASTSLANLFVDRAYASVKGYVRTYVIHRHLLEHLPQPPAAVLDVGGGAGNQSFPLAEAGYAVTILDSSPAMLEKARRRLELLSPEAQERVTLLPADGENADEAVAGQRFAGVLCHGVLGYLEDPEPLVAQLCRCAEPGGTVSIMTGNAHTMAVQPALERRWADALASFDARSGIGVLGVHGRADTVAEVGELTARYGVEPEHWYGTWLFVDWLEFSGTTLDPGDTSEVEAIAAVELEASRRDPYRQLSRAFHLIGRKTRS